MRRILSGLSWSALGIAIALAWSSSARSHPGYYNTAFHAHDVAQAQVLARDEHKQIFVVVSAPERDGWPVFRWPDARTQELVDLLVRETVIVELDTERAARELPGQAGAGEALLLLRPDGTRLRAFPIDVPPAALAKSLEREFSSDAAIERIEAAIEARGPSHFVSRERLAHALQSAGRDEAALAEYRYCIEAAIAASARPDQQADSVSERAAAARRPYSLSERAAAARRPDSLSERAAAARRPDSLSERAAAARRPYVWAGLARLAERSPAALELLEESRALATHRVERSPDARKLAHDLGRLNAMLGEPAANRALFDRLPRHSRARHGLVDGLVDDLVSERRYDEVLALIDPIAAFEGEVALYRRNRIRRPASAERGSGRATREFAIERGIALAEALAAVGDEARSRALREALLAFDDSPPVRERLREAGQRSGRAALLAPAASAESVPTEALR